MFQTEEYFKEYHIDIPNSIVNEVKIFCNEILTLLDRHQIEKFTLVLDSYDQIEVGINNDKNRVILESIELDTIFGLAKIDISYINDVDYSLIPIVYLKSNIRGSISIDNIKMLLKNLLPTNYSLRKNSGSLYIIVSKNFVGQLWNIHSDPLDAKAHIVLTECEEYFIWYPKDKHKYVKRMNANKLYLFDVSINHTVFIKQYFKDFRIHVVGDLEYGKI